MRPSRSVFARLFFVIGMGSLASTTAAKAETSGWQAPSPGIQTRIWPNGAPDMEGLPPANERAVTAKNLVGGRPWTFVLDVTEPTITLFPAKGKNTGVAMIVFPGGGFQGIAIDLEGTELCDWMASKGITCAVLKYRVPKTAHYWEKDCRCHVTPEIPRALQDAQRSIRLLRARSEELQIDPKKKKLASLECPQAAIWWRRPAIYSIPFINPLTRSTKSAAALSLPLLFIRDIYADRERPSIRACR